MEAVIAAAIAAVGSIVATVVSGLTRGQQKRYQQLREQQEAAREHMDAAIQQSLLAVLEAQEVQMIALQGGHLNGNVESAKEKVITARADLQQVRSKAISHLM